VDQWKAHVLSRIKWSNATQLQVTTPTVQDRLLKLDRRFLKKLRSDKVSWVECLKFIKNYEFKYPDITVRNFKKAGRVNFAKALELSIGLSQKSQEIPRKYKPSASKASVDLLFEYLQSPDIRRRGIPKKWWQRASMKEPKNHPTTKQLRRLAIALHKKNQVPSAITENTDETRQGPSRLNYGLAVTMYDICRLAKDGKIDRTELRDFLDIGGGLDLHLHKNYRAPIKSRLNLPFTSTDSSWLKNYTQSLLRNVASLDLPKVKKKGLAEEKLRIERDRCSAITSRVLHAVKTVEGARSR